MEMQSLAAHGNAGVVFSLRVAFCCISPTPATSRVVTRLCPRATPGGAPGGSRLRGDAGGMRGRALPPHGVAISTGSPAETLAADAAFLEGVGALM